MSVVRHDLILEKKVSLLKDKDNGMTYRKLAEKYSISLGAVANIVKRRDEYLSDYENNQNKDTKRKIKDNMTQQIDEAVYEWFCSQRA
jgi:kinesin family protein 6/9